MSEVPLCTLLFRCPVATSFLATRAAFRDRGVKERERWGGTGAGVDRQKGRDTNGGGLNTEVQRRLLGSNSGPGGKAPS